MMFLVEICRHHLPGLRTSKGDGPNGMVMWEKPLSCYRSCSLKTQLSETVAILARVSSSRGSSCPWTFCNFRTTGVSHGQSCYWCFSLIGTRCLPAVFGAAGCPFVHGCAICDTFDGWRLNSNWFEFGSGQRTSVPHSQSSPKELSTSAWCRSSTWCRGPTRPRSTLPRRSKTDDWWAAFSKGLQDRARQCCKDHWHDVGDGQQGVAHPVGFRAATEDDGGWCFALSPEGSDG